MNVSWPQDCDYTVAVRIDDRMSGRAALGTVRVETNTDFLPTDI
jgi:hypothetical protein